MLRLAPAQHQATHDHVKLSHDQAQNSPEDQDKKSLPGFEPCTGGLGQERRDTKRSSSQLEDYKNLTCSKKQLVTPLHERLAQLS